MRIVEASLCLRFYVADGWTREAVRQLLREDQRLARVMPRYFDKRDEKIKASKDRFELHDDRPYDDCDYFAVYGDLDPFSPDLLGGHQILPFCRRR